MLAAQDFARRRQGRRRGRRRATTLRPLRGRSPWEGNAVTKGATEELEFQQPRTPATSRPESLLVRSVTSAPTRKRVARSSWASLTRVPTSLGRRPTSSLRPRWRGFACSAAFTSQGDHDLRRRPRNLAVGPGRRPVRLPQGVRRPRRESPESVAPLTRLGVRPKPQQTAGDRGNSLAGRLVVHGLIK